MSGKSGNEIHYMNFMKFMGIIYLMIWHTGINKLNVIVISFFLQMFFFISGYFYKEIYSTKPFIFIRKRLLSLYLPYVCYCSLFLILNNLLVRLNLLQDARYITFDNTGHYLLQILTLESRLQMAGAMWFVSALFIASLIFCCVSAVLKKITALGLLQKNSESVRFLLVTALFLLGNYFSIKHIRLPKYLDIALVLLFFYYLGYLYKTHEHKIPFNIHLALASLLTLLLSTRYGFPQFAQRKYIDPSFIILSGVAGIYLNIFIAKKLAAYKTIPFVNYAGRNTMVILALHFLAFKMVSSLYIYIHDLPVDLLASFPLVKSAGQYYRWLYALSGLLVPLAVKYLFDRGVCRLKALVSGQKTPVNP